jgi:membrane-bound lytic murein transglycosylase B
MSDKGSEGPVNMSSEYVSEARGMAEFILQRVHRGPGDTVEAAMHRAERTYGVPAAWLHRLRYRQITDMPVSAFGAIVTAYRAASAHAERTYESERRKHEPDTRLVGFADLVAGRKVQEAKE